MANVVTITPAQFASFADKLGHSFMPAAVRGVRSGVLRCVAIVQRRTSQAPPASPNGKPGAVNFGAYKAAWKVVPLATGAILLNDRGYAAVIEFGRRPSPVSREGRKNLELWAQRRLHLSADDAKSAAFLIARSLRTRPLQARRVVTGGMDEMTKAVLAEVERELGVELRR